MDWGAKPLLGRALAALGVVLVVATVAAAVLVGGGDSGSGSAAAGGGAETTDDSGSGSAAAGGGAETTDTVTISDFTFIPPDAEAQVGSELTWTNEDSTPHTATSGTSPSADGTFDTESIEEGETATVTFDEPGTFEYFCTFHAYMTGTVTVVE
jgi:plastocyanin